METGIRGKTALITGGSSGIGRAIAMALACEGVDIAIASNQPDDNGATVEEIRTLGVRAVGITADVSVEAQVVEMVAQAITSFGHLDLFVNNAAGTWHQPITRITSESWFK